MVVWVVILNFNSTRQSVNAIKSLLSVKKNSKDLSLGVCFIDNASSELAGEEIKTILLHEFSSEFKSVRVVGTELANTLVAQDKMTTDEFVVIFNDSNEGYGRGNNKALKILASAASPADYYIIMNPDVLIDEKNFDQLFQLFRENPKLGLLGTKLIKRKKDGNDILQGIGGQVMPFGHISILHKNGNPEEYFERLQTDISYPIGAFLVFSSSCLRDVGIFNETFFMYGEELDIASRIRLKGYQVGVTGSVGNIHYEEGSVGNTGKKFPKFHHLTLSTLMVINAYYRDYLLLFIGMFLCKAIWFFLRLKIFEGVCIISGILAFGNSFPSQEEFSKRIPVLRFRT